MRPIYAQSHKHFDISIQSCGIFTSYAQSVPKTSTSLLAELIDPLNIKEHDDSIN